MNGYSTTVGDLIKELQKYDKRTYVLIEATHYNSGYQADIEHIRPSEQFGGCIVLSEYETHENALGRKK